MGDTKWNEWCPPERRHGFDFWYSYGTYDYHNKPMYWRTHAKRNEYHYVKQWGPEHEADLAIDYLRNENGAFRDPNKPFGLVVGMNPPHMPYEYVPERYVKQYERYSLDELCKRSNIPPAGTKWGDYYRANIRNYFAMITGVDDQFGRILCALEDTGLADNTIIVFTSDHGNCLGIHNMIAKNNYYEESIRVPFIIRWPDVILPQRDNLLFSAPDIYPTLLDLMGFGKDIPESVQGTSYADLFRGDPQERPQAQLCMRMLLEKPHLGWRGIRTSTHTFVIIRQPDEEEQQKLFNNDEDPYQCRNIAPENPALVAHLSQELTRLLYETGDPWLHEQGAD
jgi:arylsulfatase A-like enzyme